MQATRSASELKRANVLPSYNFASMEPATPNAAVEQLGKIHQRLIGGICYQDGETAMVHLKTQQNIVDVISFCMRQRLTGGSL